VETLEGRVNPSWGSIPPAAIFPPANALSVAFDAQGDAVGIAAITANENDFYTFVAPISGNYAIGSVTPQSNLDTVLGVYTSTGSRIAFNDDISRNNLDSQVVVTLTGGSRYYFGITNYFGSRGGSYTWLVDGPSAAPAPPAPPRGAFDIVVRVSGLTASQQQVFDRAAARWEQIITADIPDATYQGVFVDDLLIDARGRAIDGSGGVLGQAGPDAFRSGSRLPIHGTMQFDSADLAAMEANGQLYAVVLHEMGHVLGIGTIWQALGLLTGAGTSNPRFVGANATAAYNAIFGTNATSVPVEGTPSPAGSRDSHWRESVFGNELMTPYIAGSVNPISRVTVASLADLGYTVNLNSSDTFG